ncbi:hypothetical protein [Rhizobium anhuiense]|uniref:hypothetical protein n=1 Tax=Rhizobium anhuiense TaxID=1184720 RepID=UPI0007B52AD8|nr:hypothetical protein [Rhizobium anhuiense]KZS54105.1 hypothetical protein AS890_18330 [Rhizobium anhuiense bv. trifolii]
MYRSSHIPLIIILNIVLAHGVQQAHAWETNSAVIQYNSAALSGIETILPAEEVIVPYPDDSVVLLGEGFDLITGLRRPAYCVTAGPAQQVVFNDRRIHFSETTDEESLLTKLNTSLSAKASYAGYSGGGSYKSSVETKSSSKDINIVAQVDIKSYANTMKVPDAEVSSKLYPDRRFDLSPEAIALLSDDKTKFRQFCGDGYVAQITYGADFYAKFNYSELDFEKKTHVEASLEASGPAGVFSATASSTLDTDFKQKNIKEVISAFERGVKADKLAYNRDTVVNSYESFATRAEGHERPLFITVRRYMSLPSGKGKDYEIVSEQLDAMVRRVLRLRSLIADFDDAIYQREGGKSRGFIFFDPIEKGGVRDVASLHAQRDRLKVEVDEDRAAIRNCLESQNEAACKLRAQTTLIDGNALPASTSDDLALRAVSPVARNIFSENEIVGINRFIALGGTLRKAAACNVVQAVGREYIEDVAASRCDAGECLPDPQIVGYQDLVYKGFDVSPSECNQSLLPFPSVPAPTKGLGVVPVPAGNEIEISSSSDAKGYNDFSLEFVCADGSRTKVGTFVVTKLFFVKLHMNCNLEVRGSHGPASTLYNGRPSVSEIPNGLRYLFKYDDDARGGVDFNDMVVDVHVTAK